LGFFKEKERSLLCKEGVGIFRHLVTTAGEALEAPGTSQSLASLAK